MTTFHLTTFSKTPLLTTMILFSLSLCSSSFAFIMTTKTTTTASHQQRSSFSSPSTRLHVTESSELFKGGLLADEESQERAVELASRKLRKISDLGWKGTESSRRQSNIRPKLWSFGGNSELAIQDKANYSPENPNCPEPWLGLEEFYSLLNDDTAAADLIFVSLSGGRAFVERNVAESVLDRWWGTSAATDEPQKQKRRQKQKQQFDRLAFEQTVKAGQRDFIAGWSLFAGLTGFAVVGIVFPTNPLELALVDLLDAIF